MFFQFYHIYFTQKDGKNRTSIANNSNLPKIIPKLNTHFEKLGNFLAELEKNHRIIEIDNIYLKNDWESAKLDSDDDYSFLNQKIEIKLHTVSLSKAKL